MLCLKMMNKRNIIVIVIILMIGIGFFIKKATWDNTDFLCLIAEGFDEPSMPFYILIDRVYKLSEKNGNQENLERFLSEDEYQNLLNLYIRIAGVKGNRDIIKSLFDIFSEFNDLKQRSTVYYIVASFGNLGYSEAVPFLENLLSNDDNLKTPISGSTISSSLFLITGKNYEFANSSGSRQKLILTEHLINARNVIISSKGRKRTYEEMVTLDNLFRPPDFK